MALRYPAFFFLPGRMPAKTFLAFSISRLDQSRIFTVPTFTRGGASTVFADTWRCKVRIVTPNFSAAWRVENLPFMRYTLYQIKSSVKRCKLRCKIDWRKGAKGGE